MVSVPNVSHFDVALRLLCGRWIPTETGLLDSTHIRFFTEATLANLFERTGWEIVARDDFSVIRGGPVRRPADRLAAGRDGRLPCVPVAGREPERRRPAVRLGPATGPGRAAGPTYLDAVGLTDRAHGARAAICARCDDYLDSVGILASEANRRSTRVVTGYGVVAGSAGRDQPPVVGLPSRCGIGGHQDPARRGVFQRVYGWLR